MRLTATSAAVEGEFNDLKNRVLKNDCRPMRLDKFVSLHLKSFSGKAKLAAAVRESDFVTENESQQRNINSSIVESTIKIGENYNNISLIMEFTTETEENHNKTSLESTIETEKNHNNISLITEFTTESEENRNRTSLESTIEMEENHNNTSLITEFTTETEENRNKTSLESTIETEEKRLSFSLENEEINDLVFEQNWKNKNITTKIKRSYLQGRPDWNTISIAKNAVGITVLKNGNLCPAISEKNFTYIIQNTCGFDSLVHIFASTTMYESFNIILKTESTKMFSFIKQYVEKGPTKRIYKERAELLKNVEFFIRNGATSDIKIIDALSNVTYLCEQVFNENPSYKIKNTCNECQNSKSRSGIILPIQTKIIEEHGYKKLYEAIIEYVAEISKTCKTCNKNIQTEIEYGSLIH